MGEIERWRGGMGFRFRGVDLRRVWLDCLGWMPWFGAGSFVLWYFGGLPQILIDRIQLHLILIR